MYISTCVQSSTLVAGFPFVFPLAGSGSLSALLICINDPVLFATMQTTGTVGRIVRGAQKISPLPVI